MNHYATLGIDKSATQDEIKKAYRKLASIHHPDKGGQTEKFKEIQVAYAALETEEKRAQYDNQSSGRSNNHQFNFRTSGDFGNMDDIINAMRGGGGANPFEDLFRSQFHNTRQHNRAPQRNKDIRMSCRIDFSETLADQVKIIKIKVPDNNVDKEIQLQIPRGVWHGSTIKYSGLGDDAISTLPRGDLIVQFHVTLPENYEQHGMDLITSLTINALDAIVGCEKEITGADGKTFMLTIPPGSQYGTRFGVKDQGAYSTNEPGRGRLIVLLNIVIPTILSDEQLKTIRGVQQSL